jgi:hypothetical protein
MARRRQVRRSQAFLEAANRLFPPGGSVDGRASFELFEVGPLAAIEELFARDFESQPEAVEGTAIRFAMTHGVPVFPPLVVYAVLVTDDVVELIDIIVDDDYFDLIGDDSTE